MLDGVLNAFTYPAVFGHESTYYANKSSIRSEYSAIERMWQRHFHTGIFSLVSKKLCWIRYNRTSKCPQTQNDHM